MTKSGEIVRTMERNQQKAGANSQQLQAARDIVIYQGGGVTEERAREIASAAADEAVARYSAEAQEQGRARMKMLDDRLVPELASVDQLDILKDPAFQVLLTKAHISAASTEREIDYDTLTRLLVDRTTRTDRPARAAIDRAVQVVDLVDEVALDALTLWRAVTRIGLSGGDFEVGLDLLDGVAANLMPAELPLGQDWLDHLDALGLVRLAPGDLIHLKKLATFYSEVFPGFVATGVSVAEDGELQASIESEFGMAKMPSIPHSLKPGYMRLPFVSMTQLTTQLDQRADLDAAQRTFVEEMAKRYGVDTPDTQLIEPLAAALDTRPNLRHLREWWDQIPSAVSPTSIGVAMVRANVVRLDPERQYPQLLDEF